MENYKVDRIAFEEFETIGPILNTIEDNSFQGSIIIPDENSFFVEVPVNYQEIRRNDLEKAIDWRVKFQEICVSSLANDYLISDYHSVSTPQGRKNFYQIQRRAQFDGF